MLAILRLVWLPILTAIAVGSLYSLSPPYGILWFGIGWLVVAGWLVTMVMRAIRAFRVRHWQRAALIGALTVCIWPVLIGAVVVGDYTHFGVAYPFYELKILRAHSSAPISFDWGGTSDSGRSLVYDASEKTALNLGRHSLPDEPSVSIYTQHFVGNFYLVEADW